MKALVRILVLALLTCVLGAGLGPVQAEAQQERIRNFQSLITVHPDASMTVTENITVQAAGREIRRGIIRDFPTTYRDRLGQTVKVGFDLEEVLRDGRPEPYRLSHASNGVKIQIGQQDVFLRPGLHTYTITYRTTRQLGFFQDFDELYWNVTGNGWSFPIDAAEAVVQLPPGAKILQSSAYTGYQGEKGRDFSVRQGAGEIIFKTTAPLASHQGLTIAVAWPKGIVTAPTAQDRFAFFLKDNQSAAVGGIWLALLLGFYLFAWVRVGRDPAQGVIIPLFTPPANFSPPAVRYVERMGYDDKTFAAAVVDLAVKGALTIREDDGDYTLVKRGAPSSPLSRAEVRVAERLFTQSDTLKLENTNHTRIKAAIDALKSQLKVDYEKIYFATNLNYFICGLVLTLIAVGFIAYSAEERAAAAFSSIWLSVWTVACFFLAVNVYRQWQGATDWGKKISALMATLFAAGFWAGEIAGLVFFSLSVSVLAALLLLAMGLVNALFHHLLKAPTMQGRQLMDQIEGFKMYLGVAEQDRLNVLNPPEKTPELFEKYLPYALALNVENEWCQQFTGVLAQAGVGGQAYSPGWYSGRSWDSFSSSRFSSSLGSAFAGAIASASTAPGSSSGSGGGGSSGGGGGGGGGSGW
jgi:hypothetical protein